MVTAIERPVTLTNPGKVLFPDDGITKADLVDYYRRMAPVMVPHLRGRPVMLQRFPEGVGDGGFYQKKVSDYFPDWVPRVEVAKEDGTVVHAVVDNARTLVYLAGQATLTFHAWLSRADRLHQPDQMIFDLDPQAAAFELVRQAALELRQLLEELGLAAYVKTTGSRGLHVVTPLRRRDGFDAVRDFARGVGQVLVSRSPERLTMESRKARRGERVYVDVLRNGYSQTAVAPYCVRALPGAPVATPVEWTELDGAGFGPRRWKLATVGERLEANGDPWAGMGRHARSLSGPRRRLKVLLKR